MKLLNINDKMTTFKLYLYVYITFLIVLFIYYFLTKFEKVVTIKKKFNYGIYKFNNNFVSDEKGDVYMVVNSYIAFYFRGVEDFSKMEIGKKYKITGYGYRIGFLDMYPMLTSVKLM